MTTSDPIGNSTPRAPAIATSDRSVVAIVGPPNSGKSTLFNRLTGLRQKVANFPGVTVEQRVGRARIPGREVLLVDLPGIYSLTPRSEDERVSRDVLTGTMPGIPRPSAIVLILDSTNLQRHLVLAAPVLSLGIPTLVVLNLADDLASRGGGIDREALASELGAPVALISARSGAGVEQVRRFLQDCPSHSARVSIPLPVLNDVPACRSWATQVGADADYVAPPPPRWSRRIDALLLHPVLGPLLFLLVVLAVFQSIFSWAQPLMDWIELGVAFSGRWLGSVLPSGVVQSLVVDGVWAGVGAVLVFLPQILLLFLFIGALEDSGYLARAALIADRTMARVGLQGKSFIPLLSAYACAVPAVMATRTIENKRDRLATIFVAPFMTCSARLPVYTLMIAAFIPDRPVLGSLLGLQATVMLGLYAAGFLAAVATAKLLKSSILRSKGTPFMLEMPPYRRPSLRSLALRLVDRARVFVRRAGTVILGVSIVLWLLAAVPLHDGASPPIEESLAGQLGRLIEPWIEPLGLNWKIGIGLLTSLAAREVIVGTLGTIYGLEGKSQSDGLRAALQADLSLPGCLALLAFFAFALQCLSTVAVVRRETGGWKWPLLQFAYMGALAYLSAFATYTVASLWF